MQKNFHIGKFFERARRRSLRLDITTRAIGVERSFLLWAPGAIHVKIIGSNIPLRDVIP